MGKNKKTRWRTFSFDGSKDETQVNGAELKVNGTTAHSSENLNQKYSQILGDHHTNYTTQLSNKSSTSSSQSHQVFKARSYNNKENYFNNQRSALRGASGPRNNGGWHRGSSANYRATAVFKDGKREGENVKSGSNGTVDDGTEPIKFNEDEYTRITTPRQDVLFKKGYLSRMNSKTANSISPMMAAASNSLGESTAPNSATTTTNSDPDSSPATTPSMEYAAQQQDSMEYAPVYYPGYYDENGMLVIPMYNGYNYYSPNASATSSPVILLPYPYPYDPFFMAPNTEVPLSTTTETDRTTNDGDDEEGGIENEKAENDGAKENNRNAEEQMTSDVNEVKHENEAATSTGTPTGNETEEGGEQKTNFPVYANDLSYMYQPMPSNMNSYYNPFYYYNNGMPTNRPKIKRRKRFSNSRNSHSNTHPPRSADTTTDYSDEDNSATQQQHNKRYHYPQARGGWTYPHNNNGYNQYHYYKYNYGGGANKYHRQGSVDQTAVEQHLQKQHESILNVDVQEFFPRVQQQVSSGSEIANAKEVQQKNEFKCDVPATKTTASLAVDLEQSKTAKSATIKASQQQQQQKSLPPPLPVRATKKEIMEGTKSMEQQNINLIQKSAPVASNLSLDVEWNVIKKGKKVKIVKGEDASEPVKSEAAAVELPIKKNISSPIEAAAANKTQETIITTAKPLISSQQQTSKSKKAKNKSKKKKPQHLMTKQHDGFEIIEPQFGNSSSTKSAGSGEEDSIIEEDDPTTELNIASENIVEKLELLIVSDETEEQQQQPEVVVANGEEEEMRDVEEVILQKLIANNDCDDAVIDISDEEICCKTSIEIDLVEIAQEIIRNDEPALLERLESSVTEKISPKKDSEKKKKNGKISGENSKENSPAKELKSVDEKVQKHSVIPLEIPQALIEEAVAVKSEEEEENDLLTPTFDDFSFFADHKNIAELERDLIENLRSIDDGIDIKSPLINPLYDFPITTAVSKWLHERQNESFENLFHVQNFKKLSELYDECNDDDESDISESPNNSGSQTTDSDYGSDCQAKLSNGSPLSSKSSAKFDKKQAMKGASKLRIVKESFCALM